MRRFHLALGGMLGSITLLPACQTAPPPASSSSRASFAGSVENNLGQPVTDARITIAGVPGRSGRGGRFNLAVPTQSHYAVVIEHPDYAYFSRILPGPVSDGQFRLTRAKRVAADPRGRIVVRDDRRPEDCADAASAPDGPVECGPGFAVDIPAEALVDASGNRPTGMVEVKIATFEIQTESMPAPLVEARSDRDPAEVGIIISDGAGSVEVREIASGRELNLAPDKRAKIEIPVHRRARQRGGAKGLRPTVPLFRFNRGMLRWVQIGTMARVGDSYSAEVDHLTDFNADVGADPWGCIRLSFVGSFPNKLNNKAVTIQLRSYLGYPVYSLHSPYDSYNFTTTEKGIAIQTRQIIYALPTELWYGARIFEGGKQYSDDSWLPYIYLNEQIPKNPILPTYPDGTCSALYVYWLPGLQAQGAGGGTQGLDPLTGIITFDRPVDVLRPGNARTVIGRIERGEGITAIGLVRDQPWILVLAPCGQVGLVPREGADLSRSKRGEPPRAVPPPDRSRQPR